MKMAEWIMASGIVFGLGFFLLAVFDDDPWDDHAYDKAPPVGAGVPAPHRDGREKMVCSSCHEIIAKNGRVTAGPGQGGGPPPIPPITQGTPSPHKDSRDKMACANCHEIIGGNSAPKRASAKIPPPPIARGAPAPHTDGREKRVCSSCHKLVAPTGAPVALAGSARWPLAATPIALTTHPPLPQSTPRNMRGPEWHEQFTLTRFQGKVIRQVDKTPNSGRENLHILVHDGVNAPRWVNVAPGWFLNQQQCSVGVGMYVKGTAYRDMALRAGEALLYAATLSVNGAYCQLRDNHMIGFWNPGFHQEEE
ncbi:magnetochrome domain-containing protein [Magnetofaba australis]|uniref:MamX n=1 Tax=Magnetofaba australis IT-1 TaxID=1434232 RepID=W0LJD8_9PROT|nr:magnetochrome domain-containing protein [Magnetofaba australis]AHG23906.1 MamX [Magnetofaba australis IT-1]OSM08653.1 putative magnetosome protein MamX [Magnetofaba australis IT-1]